MFPYLTSHNLHQQYHFFDMRSLLFAAGLVTVGATYGKVLEDNRPSIQLSSVTLNSTPTRYSLIRPTRSARERASRLQTTDERLPLGRANNSNRSLTLR